jgi:hypothetical protein
MDGPTANTQVQTLGRCLSQLRAGDSCPCCGARLAMRLAAQQARSAVAVMRRDVPDVVVLSCGECGCEISGEDGADEAKAGRPFSVAA